MVWWGGRRLVCNNESEISSFIPRPLSLSVSLSRHKVAVKQTTAMKRTYTPSPFLYLFLILLLRHIRQQLLWQPHSSLT